MKRLQWLGLPWLPGERETQNHYNIQLRVCVHFSSLYSFPFGKILEPISLHVLLSKGKELIMNDLSITFPPDGQRTGQKWGLSEPGPGQQVTGTTHQNTPPWRGRRDTGMCWARKAAVLTAAIPPPPLPCTLDLRPYACVTSRARHHHHHVFVVRVFRVCGVPCDGEFSKVATIMYHVRVFTWKPKKIEVADICISKR